MIDAASNASFIKGRGKKVISAIPCIIKIISLSITPNTKSRNENNRFRCNCKFPVTAIYPNRNKLITPSKIKCRYPITIGRKPKASVLSDGITEANCNNSFIDSAHSTNKNIHLLRLSIIVNRCGNCFLTSVIT